MQNDLYEPDASLLNNGDVGYTAFKRKIYRDVERRSSCMADIRQELKTSWDRLSPGDKNHTGTRLRPILVCVLTASRNPLCRVKNISTGYRVISALSGIIYSVF